MHLELRALSLTYDGVTALQSLTAAIEGRVIGVLGANGSGKTSLLQILAGVKTPTAGQVFLNGDELTAGRRSWISFLPQETGFFPFAQLPSHTLSMSLMFRGMVDPQAPQRLLEAMGLADEDRSAAGYSGGMKQKLRIAQALVHRPKVLLLDEPTTGLDVRERFRVLRLLERVRDMVEVVFSTHQPEDAAAACDAVMILDHGRIVALGSPLDMIERAEGQVFQVLLPNGDLPSPVAWEIVQAERTPAGLRIRGVGAPPPGATPVPPTLEDAYVLLISARGTGP